MSSHGVVWKSQLQILRPNCGLRMTMPVLALLFLLEDQYVALPPEMS
jgi:hypothetical protein